MSTVKPESGTVIEVAHVDKSDPIRRFAEGRVMNKFWIMVFCLVCGESTAMTGNEFQSFAARQSPIATGYIYGILDAEAHHIKMEEVIADLEKRPEDKRRYFCRPLGSTVGQASDIAIFHMRQHPEDGHIIASQLVQGALLITWPCTKK